MKGTHVISYHVDGDDPLEQLDAIEDAFEEFDGPADIVAFIVPAGQADELVEMFGMTHHTGEDPPA